MSAMGRALFNLNTHYRRAVFSILDNKNVHLRGQFCPFYLL